VKSWRTIVALSATLALALEVPSFLGAPAVQSTGSQELSESISGEVVSPVAPVEPEVVVENIVSEVIDEAEVLYDQPVDCQVTPCVALTFDDGPGPYTTDILEILEEFGVGATFYPVGIQIRSWPGLIGATFDAGHDIGNHTMSHPKLSKLSVDDQQKEIVGLDNLLIEKTGDLPTSIRPPFGDLPSSPLPDPHNRPVVLWSVDSLDWKKRSAEAIIDEVLADVGAGDIILMHELYQRTVDALPVILAELAARGLTVVSVTDLLGLAISTPGIVKSVPFRCPLTEPTEETDTFTWCAQNPNWRRVAP